MLTRLVRLARWLPCTAVMIMALTAASSSYPSSPPLSPNQCLLDLTLTAIAPAGDDSSANAVLTCSIPSGSDLSLVALPFQVGRERKVFQEPGQPTSLYLDGVYPGNPSTSVI